MEVTKRTPDEYIASLPDEYKGDIAKLDQMITSVSPTSHRVMWEGKFWGGSEQKIIGYGDFSYKRSDKETVNWFYIGLALQKNYITVFVNAVEGKEYLAEKYKSKLGKVKVGRSSISFKRVEDIDLNVLKEVVDKSFTLMAGVN